MSLVQSSNNFARHVTGLGSPGSFLDWFTGTLRLPEMSGVFELIGDVESQFTRLQELSQLPPDWDGTGAAALDTIVLRKAANIVMSVAASALHVPVLIAPLPDGALQVEWTDVNQRLELVVDVDGSLSADLILDTSSSDPRYVSYDSIEESEVLGIVSLFAS